MVSAPPGGSRRAIRRALQRGAARRNQACALLDAVADVVVIENLRAPQSAGIRVLQAVGGLVPEGHVARRRDAVGDGGEFSLSARLMTPLAPAYTQSAVNGSPSQSINPRLAKLENRTDDSANLIAETSD